MNSLHIDVRGTGAIPLVMIHGWAMHGGVFAPLIERLESTCTMYVVDLPGHGYSRDSTVPLQLQPCIDAIAAQTPPAFWLGWSLGGLIALAAAYKPPAQVEGVIMLCATPRFLRNDTWPFGNDPALLSQLATDLDQDFRGTLERFIALEAMGSEDPRSEARRIRDEVFSRGEPDPRVLQEGLALLESTDLRNEWAAMGQSSLWIAGNRDRLVHPRAMENAARTCRGNFVNIAHAGHAPFIGHVEPVADALTSFFGEHA
ncbi:pimeloyl-[acyl-carrier protein] methyl ester esterase [Luteibacter sp. Sphag1AF]|uniref:pimeloyl-ACP methyl ester esterase BioH n=1 Tax=Luteibacter sp. Sphag1AF TaxID=2587031 RepID=UPI00160E124A|nr:pimeloyl-ACP methyl ester esterase BioH [Luteibacter sp. Sphag1AF]MBB3228006.1 pimeloyl-[acyl-carrier protein] methyl ester esterase [Luteibacter sp. Sphag1AF]